MLVDTDQFLTDIAKGKRTRRALGLALLTMSPIVLLGGLAMTALAVAIPFLPPIKNMAAPQIGVGVCGLIGLAMLYVGTRMFCGGLRLVRGEKPAPGAVIAPWLVQGVGGAFVLFAALQLLGLLNKPQPVPSELALGVGMIVAGHLLRIRQSRAQ